MVRQTKSKGKMKVLGIDIGGSALKGAIVDTETGRLCGERYRIDTPKVQTPSEAMDAVRAIALNYRWSGLIGIGFPGAIIRGRVAFLGNLSAAWTGRSVTNCLSDVTGCQVTVVNDADAAGIAEMRFGAGRGVQGTVLILTAGTGIGSALFRDGHYVPNLELGQVEMRGKPAEKFAAAAVRRQCNLTWAQWAKRFNSYLSTIENIVWPDLIIVGGGISKEHKNWFRYLKIRSRIVPAKMHNDAGIVGAALAATFRGGEKNGYEKRRIRQRRLLR